ncbi:MAG: hypothetical protein IT168_22185 [Bryobacterales bacterium]|nr:hypothetical protein [Bryobacterales bacterium]
MTSFFPDVNTWLALAWEGHVHHSVAIAWFQNVSAASPLIFSRYSQLGLLRLVTNSQVMGDSALSLQQAFSLYDSIMTDSRIELLPEPEGLDQLMRNISRPLARHSATKAIGDLYLISFAMSIPATLVTFDKAMARAVQTHQAPVVLLPPRSPGGPKGKPIHRD